MATAYIGIGSNLGERAQNIERAITMLAESGIKLIARSSLIETAPWGVTDQPMFMNAALKAETALTPHDLLGALKDIERRMGRLFEQERWGPRVIDLDILLYDDDVIDTRDLKIPHPHMHERAFVLAPLNEIAPDATHPVLCKSVSKLLNELHP